MLGKVWRKGNPPRINWWIVWRFLRKTKNRATIWSSNPSSGIYPKKTKHKLRKACAPCVFVATLFTIVKIWRQLKVHWWMNGSGKIWDARKTDNGILFRHKEEWNLAIHNNMDGSWGHYAKWNVRQKTNRYDLTYVWSLKKNKNKSQTHKNRELIGGCQKWVEGGG